MPEIRDREGDKYHPECKRRYRWRTIVDEESEVGHYIIGICDRHDSDWVLFEDEQDQEIEE